MTFLIECPPPGVSVSFDEARHPPNSWRKFRLELTVTPASSTLFILEHCFKEHCDQSCLRGSMEKRERERERGEAGKTPALSNIGTALRSHVCLPCLPPPAAGRKASLFKHGFILSQQLFFCPTVLTSQSNVFFMVFFFKYFFVECRP